MRHRQAPEPGQKRDGRIITAKPSVLFICTGNACRSQMAEGWLRHLAGKRVDAYSAGVAPWELLPPVVKVMGEAGIDVSGQHAKHVLEFADRELDYVITLCDHARETCPVIPGAKQRLHWPIPDPSMLSGTEEKRLDAFRRTRDLIRDRIQAWLAGNPFA